MQTTFHYDVIVIGAGHGGCEAAQTAARMGAKTCVITMDMNKIAPVSYTHLTLPTSARV